VGTEEDIQWDPATDPSNRELIEEFKRAGVWEEPHRPDSPEASTDAN
jgi:hypothetical protein